MSHRAGLASLTLAAALVAASACSSDSGDSDVGPTHPSATTETGPADSATTGPAADDGLDEALAAASRTAEARSGTATAELIPAEDSGLDGARIATVFNGDDRDISIVALTDLDSYSGSGPAAGQIRLVSGAAYYQPIDLGDSWFDAPGADAATVAAGAPAGFDPLASPVAGLAELVSAAGPLSEIAPGRYRATVRTGALRSLSPVPTALALLIDPSLGLGNDVELALSIDAADGLVTRLEAKATGAAGDTDLGDYAVTTLSATFIDLDTETVIEPPADIIQIDG